MPYTIKITRGADGKPTLAPMGDSYLRTHWNIYNGTVPVGGAFYDVEVGTIDAFLALPAQRRRNIINRIKTGLLNEYLAKEAARDTVTVNLNKLKNGIEEINIE
tara:strand:- start:1766 stop:2077 length:312 start_codon:yes stop_codon:yes gene_type:complete